MEKEAFSSYLNSIGFPKSFSNLNVLDVGCGEGVLCEEAWKRGGNVTGIDLDSASINRARIINGEINYICGNWWNVPEEKYDVILCLNCLQYEKEPEMWIEYLCRHLSECGMLILECSVVTDTKDSYWIHFPSNEVALCHYPTRDLLMQILSRIKIAKRYLGSYRDLASGRDITTYAVFLCCRRKPTIILLEGNGGIGKTNLAETLEKKDSVYHFSLDAWLLYIKSSVYFSKQNIQSIMEAFSPLNIGAFCHALSNEDKIVLTDLLCQMIPMNFNVIVLEGAFLLDNIVKDRILFRVKDQANVWDLIKM